MAHLKNTLINGNLTISNGTLDIIDTNYLIKFYPVGSLYWSKVSINPANRFPGTEWKSIKNSFIYTADPSKAKEGSKLSDTKYGNKEIKLTVDQLPSHHHSNSHTHTFKAAGTISGSFTKSSSSTSSWGGEHIHSVSMEANNGRPELWFRDANKDGSTISNPTGDILIGSVGDSEDTCDSYGKSWTHQRIKLVDNSSVSCSGGGHTHEVGNITKNYSSIPYERSDEETIKSNTVSKDEGGNSSINIMPPYIERYCWERIK